MKSFKKHGVLFGIIILVVIVIIGIGGFFALSTNNKQTIQDQTMVPNSVQSLSPSSIGLKFEASPDKKKVRFTIAKASDIKGIEYELTYDANSTAQERSQGSEATVQRGITGQLNISQGSSTYMSSWLILGSQSANVVRYDSGVKSVSITFKITKTDGKVYQVQDSLNL